MSVFGGLLNELPDVMGARTREIRWTSPYAVFTDYGHLNIIDCSDPSNLVARDSEASLYPGAGEGALLVEHPLIYRGQSEWPTPYFDTWDMTDPGKLSLRSRVEVHSEYWSFMSDLAKSDNYCYISGNKYNSKYEHITVMNVSDPDNVVEETEFDGGANLANTPTGLAVDATGDYLFVACRALFTVLDISTRDTPVYSNKISITESALGPGRIRLTSDGYAYITRISANSIDIVDVRVPHTVSLIGTLTDDNFLKNCRSIQIIGNYLYGFTYVANPTDGKYYVSVWDITDRVYPSLVESVCMDDIGLWRIGAFVVDSAKDTLYVGKYTTSSAKSFASIGSPAVVSYPSNGLTRVTGIRHIYRPGSYRLEATLGDVSTSVELPQRDVRIPSVVPLPDPRTFEKFVRSEKAVPLRLPERTAPELIEALREEGLLPEAGASADITALEPLPIRAGILEQVKPLSREALERLGTIIGQEAPPEPSLWQKLTPWKEERGETFGTAFTSTFRRGFEEVAKLGESYKKFFGGLFG